MNEQLLHYFSEELACLKQGMQAFAKQYPNIVSETHLLSNNTRDPHVTRMLEAFAMLISRLRMVQDENFSNLNQSLIEVMCPQYLAALPSLSVTQFHPVDNAKFIETIPNGQLLETLPENGLPINFMTCYDTDIIPAEILQTEFSSPTFIDQIANSAKTLVKTSLSILNDDASFSDMNARSFRFYISQINAAGFEMYENLFSECIGFSIVNEHCEINQFYDNVHICPVGFDDNQALLPIGSERIPGWRLLREYLCFKEKFLFFDLKDINLQGIEQEFEIHFHFKTTFTYCTASNINEIFVLNCTPVVNLFKKTLEPLSTSYDEFEYRLQADKRAPEHYEVHTVTEVRDVEDGNKTIHRLYNDAMSHEEIVWETHRKDYMVDSYGYGGLYISFSQASETKEDSIYEVEAYCSNGNNPINIYWPSNKFHLQLIDSDVGLKGVSFMQRPTAVAAQKIQDHQQKLTLLLANNAMRMTDPKHAYHYIKSMLSEFDSIYNKKNNILIDGIVSVIPKQIIGRQTNSNVSPLVYGTEITVKLKKDNFIGQSKTLFKNILQKGFSFDVDMNSFIVWKFIEV